MKKTLQIPHLRAVLSLPDRAVVRRSQRPPREARAGGFRDRFAQLLVLDSGGPLGGGSSLLQRSVRERLDRCRGLLGGGLGKRPRDEAKLGATGQPGADLVRAMRE